MAAEPWYSVGPNDIFPEEFAAFLLIDPRVRQVFMAWHRDLLDADYWSGVQEQIRSGRVMDVFPYPPSRRFSAMALAQLFRQPMHRRRSVQLAPISDHVDGFDEVSGPRYERYGIGRGLPVAGVD